MKSLDHYLALAEKDGSVRSGIILGFRMALLGLKKLRIDDPQGHHRSLVTIIETERCLPDAVQLVTRCRLGNRTLKLRDLGKMAATFLTLETGVAVRVAARESANQRAVALFSHLDREEALQRAYRTLSEDELFTTQIGRVNLRPEEIPGFSVPRVICHHCGEGIGFGREIVSNGLVLCGSCAGEGYFEPTESLSSPD